MLRKWSILWGVMYACGGLAVGATCTPTPGGLVSWWTGDGDALDVAGGNHGTFMGGAATAPGFVGLGFNFDGTNNFVSIPDSASLRPAVLTVEAWVRFAGLDTPGNASVGQQYIVFKQNSRTGNFEGYELGKDRVGNQDFLIFRASSSAGEIAEVVSTTQVATGVWYHVAGVRGPDFLQIFINGQLQGQTSVAFAQNYGSQPVYFGTSGQSYWDRKFRGTLDEVGFYNVPLSATEIAAIYEAGALGKCKQVSIITPPESQTAVSGSTVQFGVSATGFGTLFYQWRFDNTPIPGATTSTLSLANVQSSQAGSYSVIVSNAFGAVVSEPAVLEIHIPAAILTPPQHLTILQGQNAVFNVSASGTQPLGYQWRLYGTNLAGATLSSYTRFNAQVSDVGPYTVVVTNLVGSVTSAPAMLAVLVPPTVLEQPQSRVVNQGQTATFTVTAAGTAPLSYQWRFNGNNIGGATGTVFTRNDAQPVDTGSYTVVVNNLAGAVTSVVATLTINVPPAITAQPEPLEIKQGENAAFAVTASGTAPLSYQWRFNGASIPGATQSTFVRNNVQPADAGQYSVIITNVAGSATSGIASLTVNVPPGISQHPQSLEVVEGQPASFGVTATGTAPLRFQWRFNGASIPGATLSTFVRNNVQPADAGQYSVIITNVAGSATSGIASLTVNVPPGISQHPQSLEVVEGQPASFSVIATGTAPLRYEWRFNGASIPGATLSSFVRNNVQPADAGQYSVIITNVAGSATSGIASLTVNVPPGISQHPQSLEVVEGQPASFSVTATGTAPLRYQWRFNGQNIAAATQSTFSRPSAQSGEAGLYAVVVTNVAGAVTSSPATLTVFGGPVITSQPQNRTVNQGQSAVFNVTVSGTQPFTYQWRRNGVDIPLATGSAYSIVQAQCGHAGGYQVIISNVAGVTASSTATLSVVASPVLVQGLQDQLLAQNDTLNLSVIVSAECGGGLSYQWFLDGVAIPGATSASYQLSAIQPENAGEYSVTVSNPAGFVTSSALVDVLPTDLAYIPDPNLKDAIRFALGKTQGHVTLSDLATLVSLPANERQITNLTGLQAATNLQTLYLSDNQITDFGPISGLRKLTDVELEGNRVTDLSPLQGLTNLLCAVLGRNPATNYSMLSNFKKLKNLSIIGGGFIDLAPMQQLPALVCLNLRQNGISDVGPLANLTNLISLDLRWNSLTNIDVLFSATNLVNLYLTGNSLSNPPAFHSLSQLKLLNLDENEISDLSSLAGLANLTYLTVSRNPVEDHSVLTGLSNLEHLEATGSGITNAAFLAQFPNLQFADLSFNNIGSLSGLTSLTHLHSLVLAGNPIVDYSPVAQLTQVTNLWLHQNKINTLSALTEARWLNHLNLDQNQIQSVTPLLGLTNLSGLSLSRNPVTNLAALTAMTNLSGLGLNGTCVGDLGFLSNLDKLAFLSLNENQISDISGLSGLSRLESLYLQHNRLNPALGIGALASLPGLLDLDITQNALGTPIDPAIMPVLQVLRSIDTRLPRCECSGGSSKTNFMPVRAAFAPQSLPPSITAPRRWFVPCHSSPVIEIEVSDDEFDDVPSCQPLMVLAGSARPDLVTVDAILPGTNRTRTLSITTGCDSLNNSTVVTLTAIDGTGQAVQLPMEIVVVTNRTLYELCPGISEDMAASLAGAIGVPADQVGTADLLMLTNVGVARMDSLQLCIWGWLTNLTGLEIRDSTLPNLNFLTNLPRLVSLDLARNQLGDISAMSMLGSLSYVDLSWTSISNLAPLSALSNSLVGLSVVGNRLRSLNGLEVLTNVGFLNLEQNNLVELGPLQELRNLSYLWVQQNLLTNITPITNLPLLRYVDMRTNLVDLSEGSSGSLDLETLTGPGRVLGPAFVEYQTQRKPRFDIRTNWVVNANGVSTITFRLIDLEYDQVTVWPTTANPELFPNVFFTVAPSNYWALNVAPAVGALGGTGVITLTATNDVPLFLITNVFVRLEPFLQVNDDLFQTIGQVWNDSGNAPWFGQTRISHDGVAAAQSGAINDLEYSVLRTTFTGPGRLSFWWKVSSEVSWDFLRCFIDGTMVAEISGEVDWNQRSFMLPFGDHNVRWEYYKDHNLSVGWDAGWLDDVSFDDYTWLEVSGSRPDGLMLLLHLVPGKGFELQASTNYLEWQAVMSGVANTNLLHFLDTNTMAPARFYRLRDLGAVPPAQISIEGGPTNNQVILMLRGTPGTDYEVQTSADLTEWTPLHSGHFESSQVPFVDTNASAGTRMYRLLISGM